MKITSKLTKWPAQLASTALLTLTAGAVMADLPPHNDPDLEMFRVRCQIDVAVDPATGLEVPKVQIQGKARAGDTLEAHAIRFMVENLSGGTVIAPTIDTVVEQGSATADWDTFPDLIDPVPVIDGGFAAGGDIIRISGQILESGQTVSEVGTCAAKVSQQFRQDTKNVCKLKAFNRGKCKSGMILPDGSIMP